MSNLMSLTEVVNNWRKVINGARERPVRPSRPGEDIGVVLTYAPPLKEHSLGWERVAIGKARRRYESLIRDVEEHRRDGVVLVREEDGRPWASIQRAPLQPRS